MRLQTKIRNIFTGRSIFLYVLLLFSCNNFSDKSKQHADDKTSLTQTASKDSAKVNRVLAPVNRVTDISEQDPKGIFWGLRETISGKLILDYTYQKINTFKEGFALVMLNVKFGLINKSGQEIMHLFTNTLRHNYNAELFHFKMATDLLLYLMLLVNI